MTGSDKINLLLFVALLVVTTLMLWLAFGHGREWWGSMKARKALKAVTADRDSFRKEKDQHYAECLKLNDLLGKVEAEKLKALALIDQKTKALEATEAARVRQIQELTQEMTRMESEAIALRLQVDTIAKEAQALLREANQRADELVSDLSFERERMSKLKAHTAAA